MFSGSCVPFLQALGDKAHGSSMAFREQSKLEEELYSSGLQITVQ